MTVREAYEEMGGDYEEILGRLQMDELIIRIVKRFLNDTSCELLVNSMESGAYADAFRAAHTMKGVCQNLSLKELGDAAVEITEALRDGKDIEGAKVLLPKVTAAYEKTIAGIHHLLGE